jgi:hypothetical protein
MLRGVERQPITPWFAWASLELSHACGRLGLVAPSFRSPPADPGVDRTLRRQPGGGVAIAIRLWGRSFADIRADMIDGVLAANRVARGSREGDRLHAALEDVVSLPREWEAA